MPSPVPLGLGREVGLEDPSRGLLARSRAVVGDLDPSHLVLERPVLTSQPQPGRSRGIASTALPTTFFSAREIWSASSAHGGSSAA